MKDDNHDEHVWAWRQYQFHLTGFWAHVTYRTLWWRPMIVMGRDQAITLFGEKEIRLYHARSP